jgi:Vitamin K-dependent gamma-carboxylase
VRRLTGPWERFWFEPEPAATLVLLRVAVGAVLLLWALAYAPDLATFAGPRGIVPGGSAAYLPSQVALVLAGVCLVAGYRPRLAAAAAFLCLAWLHHVDPWTLNSGDALMRDVVFLLALAPSGGGRISPWALRLVQVQVSVMYVVAAASKLAGAHWRDGTAVSYPLRIPSMTRVHLPGAVTSSQLAAHVLTWGVLGTELAIGLLVWSRRARPWVLGAGVLLHLGIEVTMRVGFFSWIVLACYVAFIPPERAERLVARWSRRLHPHPLSGEREAPVGAELSSVRVEGAEGRVP